MNDCELHRHQREDKEELVYLILQVIRHVDQ